MKALCIIDVQKDYTTTPRRFAIPSDQIERLLSRLNQLVEEAQRNRVPVVYIRQINSSWAARAFSRIFTQGLTIQGNPGCELDHRLQVVSDLVFDKERPSSFSSSGFTAWLEKAGVRELALAGLDGCFCVNATAKEALRRGFQVELHTEATVTSFPNRWLKIQQALRSRGARLKN